MKCAHVNTRLVWSGLKNNGETALSRQLRYQCYDCGFLFAGAIAHDKANDKTPDVDADALRNYLETQEIEWALERDYYRHEVLGRRKPWQDRLESEMRQRYEEHLKSPEWFEIRAKVIKRAGGICEGCGEREAQEVHHLTYKNLGSEFMWELVAVCIRCHRRWHGKPDEDSSRNPQHQSNNLPQQREIQGYMPKMRRQS